MTVPGIDGERVRGRCGVPQCGWGSYVRNVERLDELNELVGPGIDHADNGPERVAARGRVEAVIGRVEPNFVGSSHASNVHGGARVYVQDNLLGRRLGVRGRRPGLVSNIEDDTASDEQLPIRTMGKSGWLAVIYQKGRLDCAGVRIDSRDPSHRESSAAGRIRRAGTGYLRDAQIKLAGREHRLLRPI